MTKTEAEIANLITQLSRVETRLKRWIVGAVVATEGITIAIVRLMGM